MSNSSIPPDSEFDLRIRTQLHMAFEPGEPPPSLFRQPRSLWSRRGFQRSALVMLLTGGGVGAAMAQRPPELVRHAIEHEYFERSLRGSLMDPAQMLGRIGMHGAKKLPGFTQLLRPCDIDGHLVYHLTTFFEKNGMVTLFAFDQPVNLQSGGGWWGNVYWQVMRSKDDKPLVLVAKEKKALAVAMAALLGATPAAG
jgi:hypothetical protein